MTDLFDHAARLAEAERAKKEGMERVEANASEDWSSLMFKLVRLTCLEQHRFTTDDPMDRYDEMPQPKPETHDKRAMGPVMMRAAKAGLCRQADCRPIKSRRPGLHASPITVWESLIYAR